MWAKAMKEFEENLDEKKLEGAVEKINAAIVSIASIE
jgi:hypothetical protein